MYDVIREGILAVDALTRRMAVEIAERMAELGDAPMTPVDVRRATAIYRAVMTPIYGPGKARVRSGLMFREITRHTDLSAYDALAGHAVSFDRSVRRIAPDDWRRVLGAMVDADDAIPRLMVSLGGPQAHAERVARSFLLRSNSAWVDADQYRLSDRVWSLRTKQRVRIDRALRDGVRRGQGPRTIARRLEHYLSPDYAPLRYDPGGRIVRRAVTGTPGGQGASFARTLARTEIQHMHHEATRVFVRELDVGGGIRWALSVAHPRIDICDTLAQRSSRGYPPGVYTPDAFPSVPHPNCLCSAEPWLPPPDEVLRILLDRYR